ncbi:glycosyltransferase family 2 protein [Cupriavidus necator]
MDDTLMTISVVSHGQGHIVRPLLAQLAGIKATVPLNVIVTENLPYSDTAIGNNDVAGYGFTFLVNDHPKGFGANHNAAFRLCETKYFFVLNPDLILTGNPFLRMADELSDRRMGIVAPTIVSLAGKIEDSVRVVPTPIGLLRRVAKRMLGREAPIDYPTLADVDVDWAAGMFMGFRSDVYRLLSGFDERFHLYCEDVDICLRSWLSNYAVRRLTGVVVQHDARRDSHRRFRYLAWHVRSLARLLLSGAYWNFRLRGRLGTANYR